MICGCGTTRATRKLKEVGSEEFLKLAEEWLVQAREQVKNDEARCREEGRCLLPGDQCPYPEHSDQNLAWMEGRSDKSTKDIQK